MARIVSAESLVIKEADACPGWTTPDEHGQGVVAVNVIARALDVTGHTSITHASHLHDSAYAARARARAHTLRASDARWSQRRMRRDAMRCGAVVRRPSSSPGPARVPATRTRGGTEGRVALSHRIFDDPQCSDAITPSQYSLARTPRTRAIRPWKTGDKACAALNRFRVECPCAPIVARVVLLNSLCSRK